MAPSMSHIVRTASLCERLQPASATSKGSICCYRLFSPCSFQSEAFFLRRRPQAQQARFPVHRSQSRLAFKQDSGRKTTLTQAGRKHKDRSRPAIQLCLPKKDFSHLPNTPILRPCKCPRFIEARVTLATSAPTSPFAWPVEPLRCVDSRSPILVSTDSGEESIETIKPTLGPRLYRYHLLRAIWSFKRG